MRWTQMMFTTIITFPAWWVSRERRIYEVEPTGEGEADGAWDPDPSWWSFPKAKVKQCFYDPSSELAPTFHEANVEKGAGSSPLDS